MKLMKAGAVFGGMTLTALLGTVHIILPFTLLLLLQKMFGDLNDTSPREGCPCTKRRSLRRAYRCAVDAVAFGWFTCAAALLELVGRTSIRISGPFTTDDRVVLLICNHHSRVDWMYIWCMCAHLGVTRRLKIALKGSLRKVPLFGWAMQSFLFIFLSRADRDADLASLTDTLWHMCAWGDDTWVLIFPEGTDLSPKNKQLSDEHADAKGIARYRHVLHPRSAGFVVAVNTLWDRLDAVYDLTIRYENPAAVAGSEDPRPSEKWMLKGVFPRAVHVSAERFPKRELPSDPESCATWLAARWKIKELEMQEAADGAADEPKAPAASSRWCLAGKYYGTFVAWAVLLATLVLYFPGVFPGPTGFLVRSLVGMAVFELITRYFGGIDALEKAIWPPPTTRPAAPAVVKAAAAAPVTTAAPLL